VLVIPNKDVVDVITQWTRVRETRSTMSIVLGRRFRPKAYEELAVRVDSIVDYLPTEIFTDLIPDSFRV
jgi:hypothetical protein